MDDQRDRVSTSKEQTKERSTGQRREGLCPVELTLVKNREELTLN